MSLNGSDSRNSPGGDGEASNLSGVASAAGTFAPRLATRPNRKPLDRVQHRALVALITAGKLARREDGYGTASHTLIRSKLAAFLKARRYATASFDGSFLVPTEKAKALYGTAMTAQTENPSPTPRDPTEA